jgi:hypothetical protein
MFIKLGLGILTVIFLFMTFREESVQEIRDDKNKITIEMLENKRLIIAERYEKTKSDVYKRELENIDKKLESYTVKDTEQEERLKKAIENSQSVYKQAEQELKQGGN